MKQSESIAELASALSKAQGQIKPAKMDGTNPFFHSKYATLGSVWEVCRKPLADNGLSIVQSPIAPLGEPNIIGLTTTILHSSGEYMTDTLYLKMDGSKANSTQEAGTVITYGRRYALTAMLGIVADEDVDGNMPDNNNGESTNRVLMPTKAMAKKFHVLGVEVYGDGWDVKRADLTLAKTRKNEHESESSKDLTREEMKQLIDGINKKKKALAAADEENDQ